MSYSLLDFRLEVGMLLQHPWNHANGVQQLAPLDSAGASMLHAKSLVVHFRRLLGLDLAGS